MKLFLLGVFFILSFCFNAQVNARSTTVSDSVKFHSPKKAVIFSAVLPGAGQVYNHLAMPKGKKKAFWKVPLIYAGLGATGFFLINNQLTQLSLKQEYTNRENGNALDPKWQEYDIQGVETLYNQYLDARDLSILAFSAVYLLQVIDAGIEAHFVHFDISEDLSLAIKPTYLGKNTLGMRLCFNFR